MDMGEPSLNELLPDVASEISSETEESSGVSDETPSNPEEQEISPAPAVAEEQTPIITESRSGEKADSPRSPAEIILSAKVDGEPFLDWALGNSLGFLGLADLPPTQTVGALRGQSEEKIKEKINIANSILVLLAHYGSENDNKELVDACTEYAKKMQLIIKRLCL